MHGSIPWPELGYIGLPSFLCGVWVGWLSETRRETIMAFTERLRLHYDRWAIFIAGMIALLALTGIWLGAVASIQNGRNLVTNCENANESRQANRNLWGYILDLSASSDPEPSPDQVERVAKFRAYVNAVYAAHDCSNLDEKYPLPDPPAVDK